MDDTNKQITFEDLFIINDENIRSSNTKPLPEKFNNYHPRSYQAIPQKSYADNTVENIFFQAPIEQVSAQEMISFKRPGIQNREMEKLRKNKFQVDAELDLHGHTTQTAFPIFQNFIARGYSCVRIIHGKGAAILKSHVAQWLKDSDAVQAFCSATQNTGGTGAVIVLLKTS